MAGPQSLAAAGNLYWKIGVYGGPGKGKSVFACGSRTLRTMVFDVDDGLHSVKAYRAQQGLPVEAVTFWRVDSVAEFDKAMAWLEKNLSYFDLVVIDSFTELQRLIIQQIHTQSGLPTLDEKRWGLVRNVSERLISDLRHMPAHVVVTMHEINRYSKVDTQDKWMPSLDGRTRFEYAKHLSLICRILTYWGQGPAGADGQPTRVVGRALAFGPDPDIDYKDRSFVMAPYEAADLDYILAKASSSTIPQQP